MLQNHTAVSSDRNTSVKTVCCFSQRLGGQRSTKLEACWCKQHQQDVFKRIRILRSSCCIPSHINCRQNHPSFPFCEDVFCQHQGFWKPWPTTHRWLSWALQLTAAHLQLKRSWKIWEQIQSNVLACFSSNATMNSCSRVFRLASPYLARSISSNVRMGRVTLPEADWTDFMSYLRNHFWNWFVVSTQDLTLNQLWSWKMLWRIIDVCEASTSLRCLVGALLISKWLWRSMLRAWLHCGNKSQLLSFSQNERRFWRQKHVGNPTVTSDNPGIPLVYWGFAACCALWRGRRTRSGQKNLCLQHRKLHALSIKRMWLCYLPSFSGFSCWLDSWWLVLCLWKRKCRHSCCLNSIPAIEAFRCRGMLHRRTWCGRWRRRRQRDHLSNLFIHQSRWGTAITVKDANQWESLWICDSFCYLMFMTFCRVKSFIDLW